MAAMGTLALLASCSNEELPALAGNDGSITFTASLPADNLSRATATAKVPQDPALSVYESGSDA